MVLAAKPKSDHLSLNLRTHMQKKGTDSHSCFSPYTHVMTQIFTYTHEINKHNFKLFKDIPVLIIHYSDFCWFVFSED